MDCRIVMVEQNSDEWADLRRTRITASRMADVCAGKDTKRYTKYRQEKVLELLGHKNVEENPAWAEHGRENEPQALAAYEWRYEVDVEHNIMLIHKEHDWLSASPDLMHLPNYDVGGEIKCRQMYNTYRKHVKRSESLKGTTKCCPAENRHQVQTCMWLTGFSYWWLINHYIGSDLAGGQAHKTHRVAVPRDQKLIDHMELRSLEFMKECYERAELEFESR